MSAPRRLAALAGLAAIRREAAMATLQRAAAARQAAEAAVAAVDARRAEARAALADDPSAGAAVAAERFERWLDRERGRLNIELARKTAEWMEARDTAARAHGQREVLDRLALRERAEARAGAERRRLAEAPADPAPR